MQERTVSSRIRFCDSTSSCMSFVILGALLGEMPAGKDLRLAKFLSLSVARLTVGHSAIRRCLRVDLLMLTWRSLLKGIVNYVSLAPIRRQPSSQPYFLFFIYHGSNDACCGWEILHERLLCHVKLTASSALLLALSCRSRRRPRLRTLTKHLKRSWQCSRHAKLPVRSAGASTRDTSVSEVVNVVNDEEHPPFQRPNLGGIAQSVAHICRPPATFQKPSIFFAHSVFFRRSSFFPSSTTRTIGLKYTFDQTPTSTFLPNR